MARRKLVNNPFEKNANPIDIQPIGYTDMVIDSSKPQAEWERWNTAKAVQEGYKASEWVYTSVSRIATAASSVPWKVYQKQPDGGRKPYLKGKAIHPIEDLLASPNPYMNGGDFFELLTQHLYLGGNGLDRAIMLGGVPVALSPVMPDNVDVKASDSAGVLVDSYDVWKKRGTGNKPENVPASEMLHIKFTDPANLYWGISPLMAVARTVDTDVEAIKWNKISLQNRAVSDGAFIVNQAITPQQWTQLRKMVKEQHQGAKNAHSPWVLGFGMDWKPMSMTPQELDFINSRKMNRESILAVYNIPPPIAGIYSDATYNNLGIARKGFWLDTIIPFLDNIKAALTFYFKQFKAFGNDWELDYDLSGVEALRDTLADRIAAAKNLWMMGVPLSVLNDRFEFDIDLTNVDFVDVPFVAGVKSADDVVNGVAAPAPTTPPANPTNTDTPTATNSNRVMVTLAYPDASTKEGRDALWTMSDKHRQRYETSVEKVASKRLQEDYKELADSFAADGIIKPLGTAKWHKSMLSIATSIVLDCGTRTMRDIAHETHSFSASEAFDDTPSFELTDEIVRFLDDWFTIRAQQYNQTTIDAVGRVIKQGQNEGLTTREIAQRIEESGTLQEYRSMRIAATESVGLQNYSIIQAAKQSGVVQEKVWVSSRDTRVRDTHKEADGQTVPLDDVFNVGGELMHHPADFEASVAESVNCRCAVNFVLKKVEAANRPYGKYTVGKEQVG
jgi:HK97 family phage portal protein